MPLSLLGIGVSKGIAIGRARVLQHGQLEILEYAVPPQLVEAEVSRYRRALELAREQLHAVRTRIPSNAPGEVAAFIDTHLLMLQDSTFASGPIEIIVSRQCNAEWALKLQKDMLLRVFEEMDDSYLRTRRDDVEHVVRRVQHILLDAPDRQQAISDSAERIVLADDLSPAELILLHHQGVCGLVTERGGLASHTAILARSLGIPMVVGVRHAEEYISDDEMVVVDGGQGVVVAGLDSEELAWFRRRQASERRKTAELRRLRDVPAITRDGVPISLEANIELPEDVTAVRKVGAAGIGLFRTEFLFMNRIESPDEEEQYEAYRRVVKRLKGAPVTIRTLDLGADKQPGGNPELMGPNPALGLRGIRLCLKELSLFTTQIRAILRASAHGPVRMLVPMVTNLQELTLIEQLLDRVKRDLAAEGVPHNPQIPIGAMVEVPAVAICADAFASRLDFLSIGTNDLIQYTLATDRMDKEVGYLFDALHPAVLRLIATTLKGGQESEIPVSMCGEMAGDPRFTRLLLGLGLTDFSMPPSAILEVKGIITESDTAELKRRVKSLVKCDSPDALAEGIERLNRL